MCRASSTAISGADLLEVPTHLLEAYSCMRLNFRESPHIPRRYGQQIGHKVLVGGFNPSEKYEFVSWDDYSQLNGKS